MQLGCGRWALVALLWIACAEPVTPAGEAARAEPVSPDIEGSREVARRARERGVRFRAVGNEPGWLLEVGPEETLLVWDTGLQRDSFPLAEVGAPAAAPRQLETSNGRRRLRIRIAPGPCHDTMSGERFAESVELRLGEEAPLRGCGGAL